MYKFVRPEKDTTIYEYAKTVNAGVDEIVELNTRKGIEGRSCLEDYAPSRILFSFPNLNLDFEGLASDGPNAFAQFGFNTVNRTKSTSSTFGEGPPNAFAFFGESPAPERENDSTEKEEPLKTYNPSATLRLYFANGRGMPYKYEIEAKLLEKDWTEGRGRIRENINEAANWNSATENEEWDEEGGDFSSLPKVSEVFEGDDPDLNLQVDSLLSENPENGFVLKRKDESFQELSELKFFSSETRTIYVPHLLVGEDTYTFDTENSDPVEKENVTAYVSNLRNHYQQGKYRFLVSVEEKFEQREFLGIRPSERKSQIENSRYLPERSLRYEITDKRTGLKIFPFSKRYTPVSYANGTHFFDLDLKYVLPRREYEIDLKYIDPETGNQTIFDSNQTFIVEND